MGFVRNINGTPSNAYYADLNLTVEGRHKLLFGSPTEKIFYRFSLGDSDVQYTNSVPRTNYASIPDCTGDIYSTCLSSICTNVSPKSYLYTGTDKTNIFGTFIDAGRGFVRTDKYKNTAPVSIGYGSLGNYTYTYANRTNNTVQNINLFKSFNLPVSTTEIDAFKAKYDGTALEKLNNDEIIIVSLDPKSNGTDGYYGERIDGKTIKINLPIRISGTNQSITVSGTYFKNPLYSDASFYNDLLSDNNDFSQEFGYTKSSFDSQNTNVSYLFSDHIATPLQKNINNGASSSWDAILPDEVFTDTDSNGNVRALAVFKDTVNNPCQQTVGNVDICIGFAALNKGFFVLTHPTIVSQVKDRLLSDLAISDANTIYDTSFNNGFSVSLRPSLTVFEQLSRIVILRDEFNKSTNTSYSSGNTKISEIAIYNENNVLLAFAKFSQPIPKLATEDIFFTFSIKI